MTFFSYKLPKCNHKSLISLSKSVHQGAAAEFLCAKFSETFLANKITLDSHTNVFKEEPSWHMDVTYTKQSILTERNHYTLKTENGVLLIFNDLTAIHLSPLSDSTWRIFPSPLRLSKSPPQDLGFEKTDYLTCSNSSKGRHSFVLGVCTENWTKTKSRYRTGFGSWAAVTHAWDCITDIKGDRKALLHRIKEEVESISRDQHNFPKVSNLQHPPQNSFTPAWASQNWITSQKALSIRKHIQAFLLTLPKDWFCVPYNGLLTHKGDVDLSFTHVYNEKSIKSEVQSVRLRNFLLKAPWGGTQTDLICQQWVKDSHLRTASRMRPANNQSTLHQSTYDLSAHEILKMTKHI
jgi:hypothetical protein